MKLRSDEGLGFVRTQDREIRKPIRSVREVREQNVFMQQHEYTCGAAAVATLMHYVFGIDVTERELLETIEQQLDPADWEIKFATGLSVEDLMKAARSEKYGFEAEARELAMEDLLQLEIPVLVHLATDKFQHFVIYRGVVDDRVFLADPLRGNIRMSVADFQKQWTGIAAAISKEGLDPVNNHALAIPPGTQSRPELQAARRALTLRPR